MELLELVLEDELEQLRLECCELSDDNDDDDGPWEENAAWDRGRLGLWAEEKVIESGLWGGVVFSCWCLK